jgi:hypothetical protein
MGLGLVAQKRLDLVERGDKQLCVLRKFERVKPLVIASEPGKLAQAQSTNFVMTAFLGWW